MSRFNKGSREMPEMNTSSLPDLIFTILFFFMMVTSMREVTLMVKFDRPAGTQLEKLARKSCTSFIYIGRPTEQYRSSMGDGTRIQLNDKFAEANEVYDFEWPTAQKCLKATNRSTPFRSRLTTRRQWASSPT